MAITHAQTRSDAFSGQLQLFHWTPGTWIRLELHVIYMGLAAATSNQSQNDKPASLSKGTSLSPAVLQKAPRAVSEAIEAPPADRSSNHGYPNSTRSSLQQLSTDRGSTQPIPIPYECCLTLTFRYACICNRSGCCSLYAASSGTIHSTARVPPHNVLN